MPRRRSEAVFLTLGRRRTMVVSRLKVATLAVAAMAMAACGKKDNGAADTTAASRTMTADTSTMAASSTSTGAWTDANIFALLDEANAADSSEGANAANQRTFAPGRHIGKPK